MKKEQPQSVKNHDTTDHTPSLRQMEEQAAAGAHTRELTDEERASMLDGLKSKWAEVNAAYQRITYRNISTHNSTLGEIRFKETCEQQMTACEESIKCVDPCWHTHAALAPHSCPI